MFEDWQEWQVLILGANRQYITGRAVSVLSTRMIRVRSLSLLRVLKQLYRPEFMMKANEIVQMFADRKNLVFACTVSGDAWAARNGTETASF